MAVRHWRRAAWAVLFGCGLVTPAATAGETTSTGTEVAARSALADAARSKSTIALSDFLLIPAVGQYGRTPLHRDAVESELASGQWELPTAGDALAITGDEPEMWRPAQVDSNGVLDKSRERA